MPRSKCLLGLCVFVTTAAVAEAPLHAFGGVDTAPRFMIYVQQSFGGRAQDAYAPRFGVSVDRQLPVAFHRTAVRSSARLIDLQLSSAKWSDVWLNGYKIAGEREYPLGYEGGSYGEDSWGNPWLWGTAGLAALIGLSCVSDNWPCEKDHDPRPSSGYQIPGT